MKLETVAIPLLLTLLAGASTGIGSLIALFIREPKKVYLQFSLGVSAGVMVYVSFAELLSSAVDGIGFVYANAAFFFGLFFLMAVDFFIPHDYIAEHVGGKEFRDSRLMSAGVLSAIGIAIHNFPEGAAVFMSAVGDVKVGIALGCAIAIHNIPEGIAVALPIFYATGSRKKAFWFSFLSGIAEPAGAVVAAFFLMPFLTPAVLSAALAFVAGIMVFISFDELLPLTYNMQNEHISIIGIACGMAIMALSLFLL